MQLTIAEAIERLEAQAIDLENTIADLERQLLRKKLDQANVAGQLQVLKSLSQPEYDGG